MRFGTFGFWVPECMSNGAVSDESNGQGNASECLITNRVLVLNSSAGANDAPLQLFDDFEIVSDEQICQSQPLLQIH